MSNHKCPSGFTAKDGAVSGTGLGARYPASLQRCGEDCQHRNDCIAFEYSKQENKCKLVSKGTPTPPTYRDYQFCSKTGIFINVYFIKYREIRMPCSKFDILHDAIIELIFRNQVEVTLNLLPLLPSLFHLLS
jgi:hypothetical protein